MAFALVNRALPASFDITDLSLDRLTALGSLLAPLGRAIEVPLGDYDLVVDASGSASGLAKACAQVRDGGRLCMMSHLDLSSDGSFLLGALTRRDITFTVSYLNGPRETLADAARMLSTSWNADWNLVIERRPLTDLQSAFQTRRTSPYCKTVIDVSGG
jgi:threonine dehydrogenase-like Zn-dependent dehydrogenase